VGVADWKEVKEHSGCGNLPSSLPPLGFQNAGSKMCILQVGSPQTPLGNLTDLRRNENMESRYSLNKAQAVHLQKRYG
jgi:hypothetical protein